MTNHVVDSLLKVLRNHIKDRKLTLTEVADRLNTTHASVSRVLNGHSRLTLNDLAEIASSLGIPMSVLMKEAEQVNGRVHISEDLEAYLCGDSRIYAIFVALNFPITLESMSATFDLPKTFISEVIERLEKDQIVFRPGPGLYQLTDIAKDISFGRTKEFYDLKARLYSSQSRSTYDNLSRGAEYWADKDDQLKVVRLTKSQVLAVAKQIESLSAQLQTMDHMNSVQRGQDPDRGSDSQLHAVFMTLKPFNEEALRSLISRESK